MNKKIDIFAVKCYLNGKRKVTDKLTKSEAKCFFLAAKNLMKFLKKNYKLRINKDEI